MLARSFGLFGDYIVKLDIVDYIGEVQIVTKENNLDLFYRFLGGSPGNLGVLTHFKVEVHDDQKHKGSKGLWIAFLYNQVTLKALFDILVEKGQDPKFERNYDFGVNTVSRGINFIDYFPGPVAELKDKLPNDIFDADKNSIGPLHFKFALIVVYAQWANFGNDVYSPFLSNRIKSTGVPLITKESADGDPMSKIASMWLFKGDREYPYPYVKRTNTTKSTTLGIDGWSLWFSGRINEIVSVVGNGLWVSSQLQVLGRPNSMLLRNADGSTAYTMRDATIGGTWDAFCQDT